MRNADGTRFTGTIHLAVSDAFTKPDADSRTGTTKDRHSPSPLHRSKPKPRNQRLSGSITDADETLISIRSTKPNSSSRSDPQQRKSDAQRRSFLLFLFV
jgi:hypothetical protein